jgi:hypothetical protein
MARAKSTTTKQLWSSPIHTEQRICFGIAYFLTEADAQAFGDYYRKAGATYIGGYSDGMPTGRERNRDLVVTENHKRTDLQPWQKMGGIADLPLGTKIYAATY